MCHQRRFVVASSKTPEVLAYALSTRKELSGRINVHAACVCGSAGQCAVQRGCCGVDFSCSSQTLHCRLYTHVGVVAYVYIASVLQASTCHVALPAHTCTRESCMRQQHKCLIVVGATSCEVQHAERSSAKQGIHET